ncbi:raffinose/stachyose/melibiose transport system permease protein [Lachnospiraceae bacterium PF1-21]|uniref:carbohydrate ABC transporter permease n=1 Tax=Ohessyouella blattaphilus TaxID=2949333 RepID=UPI00256DDF7E|nr:carbohydrate ABC transporter permease [Lachnospiraceae bacterium OttesenSCG-928-J05]
MNKNVKVKRHLGGTVAKYAFLLIMAFVFAMPMAFTLLSSVKTKSEIFAKPFDLPEVFQWGNYIEAWQAANMSRYFVNSIIQAGATVIALALVSSMAAYVLSRFNFRGNKFLMLFFMLGMMVPMHTVLVPVSYIIGALDLKNNIPALVLIYVAFSLPFSIMVMSNFMRGVNHSLEEAALIDGATYFQIYRKVMLPLCVPAISTISIFNFLGAWNNILFPLLFINDKNLKPIALGLLNFNGERGSDYGPLMAAIVITVAVPLVMYLLFQEKVEGGLAAGAVKE